MAWVDADTAGLLIFRQWSGQPERGQPGKIIQIDSAIDDDIEVYRGRQYQPVLKQQNQIIEIYDPVIVNIHRWARNWRLLRKTDIVKADIVAVTPKVGRIDPQDKLGSINLSRHIEMNMLFDRTGRQCNVNPLKQDQSVAVSNPDFGDVDLPPPQLPTSKLSNRTMTLGSA